MLSVLAALLAVFGANISVDTAVRRLPTLGVMTLEGVQLLPQESQVLTEALTSELQSNGKLRVIERSQVEKILAEQGFQKSGACDGSECAVEVGKLVGIDRMVVGSVGKIGSSWSVVVRVVDVQTGEILASAHDTRDGQVEDLLRHSVPSLARQLTGNTAEPEPVAALPPPTPPSPTSNDRTQRQEYQLAKLVSEKIYLTESGLKQVQSLSDSVNFQTRFTLYSGSTGSAWIALANLYPAIPIGSIIQSDWIGLACMASGYIVGGALLSGTPQTDPFIVGTVLIIGTWVFQVARPARLANKRNSTLSKALRLSSAPPPLTPYNPGTTRLALELRF